MIDVTSVATTKKTNGRCIYLSRLAVQQFAAAEWCPHDNICQLPSIIIHCQTIESWLSTTTSLAPLFDPALFISFSCHLIKLKAPTATCVFLLRVYVCVGGREIEKILFHFFSFFPQNNITPPFIILSK
jgi:hypothetical protein